MTRSPLLVLAAASALTAFTAGAAASEPGYVAPRTSWGAPDLSGVWTSQTATQLERPEAYKALVATDAELKARAARRAASKTAKAPAATPAMGGGDGDVGQEQSEFPELSDDLTVIDGRARTSIITDPADGRLPLTPEGERRIKAAKAADQGAMDNPEDRSASERCLAASNRAGPPIMSGPDNAYLEIVQTPDRVGVLSEQIHDLRVIGIGAAHAPTRFHPIGGDSIGRWEGGALVVETVDQSPITSPRDLGASTFWVSPQGKVVERLRRISPTEILYGFTVTDPEIYSRPWSGEMVLRKADKQVYEYACHEGNYALVNVLSGAREKEKAAGASTSRP